MDKTTIIFKIDGKTHEIPYEDGDSILDSAIRNSLEPPYSCLEGVCSTCLARIEEGEVQGFGPSSEYEEVEDGCVLTCQTRPKSGRVVINYDDV